MAIGRGDRLKFERILQQAEDGLGLERFEPVDVVSDVPAQDWRMLGRLDNGREVAWYMPADKWFITRTGSAS